MYTSHATNLGMPEMNHATDDSGKPRHSAVKIQALVLIRVEAPHFVAGVLIDPHTDRCVQAAPILRWCQGKRRKWILAHCASRGWRTILATPQD